MAVVQTQEFRTITNNEVGNGDGLSTRAATDLIRGVNNRLAYVEAPIVITNQMWRGGYALGTGAAPAYAAKWPGIWVPPAYSSFRIDVHAFLTAGASTNLIFYFDATPYVGIGLFSDLVQSATINVNSGTPANYSTTISGLGWVLDNKRWIYLVMYRDNAGATDNCTVRVLHVCALPPA